MSPALVPGDLVFVYKSEYNLRIPFSSVELLKLTRPKLSDVAVFTLPDKDFQTFIKRIVAVEGDKVEIREGRLYLNDEPATYQSEDDLVRMTKDSHLVWEQTGNSPARLIHWAEDAMKDYGPVDVPPGHFFAMGDNRSDSVDSRVWGPIPASCLKGKAELVWLSVNPEGGLRKGRSGIRIK